MQRGILRRSMAHHDPRQPSQSPAGVGETAQCPGLQEPCYRHPPMTLSSQPDIYRLEPGLPPGMAVLRVAVAETTTILAEVADARFTVSARVHSLRKFTKRIRSLLRLVRSGLPDFKAANVMMRDIARLVSSHRDARVMAGLVENLGRSRTADPVVDWFDYRAEAAEKLAADKLMEIAEQLQALIIELDAWDFSRVTVDHVLAGFRKTFTVVLESGDLVSDQSDREEAHEWRKCCKDHWYHLRLLHDVLPKKERARIDDYDKLCDLLGNVHDRDVLLHHLDILPDFLGETRQATAIARGARRERKVLQAEAVALATRLLDAGSRKLASNVRRNWVRQLHPRR